VDDRRVLKRIFARRRAMAGSAGAVNRLGLHGRVKSKDWFPSHQDLMNSLSKYRGVVLPSIEDANGIVAQEAMALGLPAICLDWGGPDLLANSIDHPYDCTLGFSLIMTATMNQGTPVLASTV
jgi:glycosyltransferase involved in cell wall biosynthesis